MDLKARKITWEPLPNVLDVTELNTQSPAKMPSKRSSLKVNEGSPEKVTVLNQILAINLRCLSSVYRVFNSITLNTLQA